MDIYRIGNADGIEDLNERSRGSAAGLRASDADRAATADVLRRQYTAGRLDTQEFEERVGRCYMARTVDELHELVVDLPRGVTGQLAPNRVRAGRRPIGRLGMVVPLVILLLVVSGLTGAHVVWLAWPLAFFIIRAGPWQGWQGAWW